METMINELLVFPTLEGCKRSAKIDRKRRKLRGEIISHAAALEQLAKQLGFRDWNTCRAKLDQSIPFRTGQKVKGRYLDQSFYGEIVACQLTSDPNLFRVSIQFDQPVNVVTFEGMSNNRSRIYATVDNRGTGIEHFDGGQPQIKFGPVRD